MTPIIIRLPARETALVTSGGLALLSVYDAVFKPPVTNTHKALFLIAAVVEAYYFQGILNDKIIMWGRYKWSLNAWIWSAVSLVSLFLIILYS